jgi:branched-chain amino acid transport system ATP-binding protein
MTSPTNQSPTPSRSQNELLRADNLCLSFGGLKAVQNFTFDLPNGALYGLIGPNGAGKTTVFNLLTGVYRPDGGSIQLAGTNLVGRKPHEITAAGIARTFQNIRLFPDLSVLDNVCLAGQLRSNQPIAGTVLQTRRHRRAEIDTRDRCLELLALFGLQDRSELLATSLSYGHQRYLEIIRALATEPKVLLLDEPAAGLNSREKEELATSIRDIRTRFNVAILLIDHDMKLVMEICEQIAVLDHGVTIAEGPPAAIQCDPAVIAAYLGSSHSPK